MTRDEITNQQTEKPKPPTVLRCSNYRVVIPVNERYHAASLMLQKVKRHIDDGGESAYVAFDSETFCQFCGRTWETDANGYPWCCNKAQDWADDAGIKPEHGD